MQWVWLKNCPSRLFGFVCARVCAWDHRRHLHAGVTLRVCAHDVLHACAQTPESTYQRYCLTFVNMCVLGHAIRVMLNITGCTVNLLTVIRWWVSLNRLVSRSQCTAFVIVDVVVVVVTISSAINFRHTISCFQQSPLSQIRSVRVLDDKCAHVLSVEVHKISIVFERAPLVL